MRPLAVFAPARSQYEVARILGIDRSRVHQIEKRALKKLREALGGIEDSDSSEARAGRAVMREFADLVDYSPRKRRKRRG